MDPWDIAAARATTPTAPSPANAGLSGGSPPAGLPHAPADALSGPASPSAQGLFATAGNPFFAMNAFESSFSSMSFGSMDSAASGVDEHGGMKGRGSGGTGNRTPQRPQPAYAPFGSAASFGALCGSTPVEVDGLTAEEVDALFQQADVDGNGRVAGSEATALFKRSGLPNDMLSKIWNKAKAAFPSSPLATTSADDRRGLDRQQFAIALRLVAAAQATGELEPATSRAALSPRRWRAYRGAPPPPPRFAPAAGAARALDREGSGLMLQPRRLPPAPPGPSQQPTTEANSGTEEAEHLGFDNLAVRTPTAGPRLSLSSRLERSPGTASRDYQRGGFFGGSNLGSTGSGMSAGSQKNLTRSEEHSLTRHRGSDDLTGPPAHYLVRPPPLHPKLSANLCLLAAGGGSLFAGPSARGGVLQWTDAEGDLRRPADGDEPECVPLYEDNDAAPACEMTEGDAKSVTAMLVDDVTQRLWLGHGDGRLSAYCIAEPGRAIHSLRKHVWQAHKAGALTAICRTAWGDIWTGSSRGVIRVWASDESACHLRTEFSGQPRELRRSNGARSHAGAVDFLVTPAGGQVVWSAGSDKSMLLWCAHTGAFLGALKACPQADVSLLVPSAVPLAGEYGVHVSRTLPPVTLADGDERKLCIDPAKGLGLDSDGVLACKAGRLRRCHIAEEQEGWYNSSDRKAAEFLDSLAARGGSVASQAGKAAKFLGKLGQKLAGRLVVKDDGHDSGLPRRESSFTRTGLAGRLGGYSASPTVADDDDDASHDVGGRAPSGGLKALVTSIDGSVWAGYKHGQLEKYTAAGKLLFRKEIAEAITAMGTAGLRTWVGTASGSIRVYGDTLLEEWPAHAGAAVVAVTVAGSRVYTLGADGSLRGWSAAIPSPWDVDVRVGLRVQAPVVVGREELQLLCLTWNVNEQKPVDSRLFRHVRDHASGASLALIALQEIEMGGQSVATAAVKDALMRSTQEKGNANVAWWSAQLLAALGGEPEWLRVGLRQLSGMLLLVFARNHLKDKIGEVSTASVACGVLGVGGNKGAVAVSFSLFRRRVTAICSHFAAHQGAVAVRNANYATILRQLTFAKKAWFDVNAAPEDAERHLAVHRAERAGVSGDTPDDSIDSSDEEAEPISDEVLLVQSSSMRDAELLVWMGDFNYRVETSYEEAKEAVRRKALDALLEKDQLRREMAAGRIFRGLHEAPITFAPTYKFDKHTEGELAYDSSEKRRVPAWTDRIFFRGSEDLQEEGGLAEVEEEVTVRASDYQSTPDVIESDHKPVWARLHVSMRVDKPAEQRAAVSALLAKGSASTAKAAPAVAISTDRVRLDQDGASTAGIELTNTGEVGAVFSFEPSKGGEVGLPHWLGLHPISGYIPSLETVRVTLKAALADNVAGSHALQTKLLLRVDGELSTGGSRGQPPHARARDKVVVVEIHLAGSTPY